MLDASNTYLILQLFPCFSLVVSGLPDLTGKWKQAFTVLTPVDFDQPVFTGKAVTPKQWVGRSNRLGNVCLKGLSHYNLVHSLFIDYSGAAEPPVRCGVSHHSGLTEPPVYCY